jgi:glycosyltransferase involved in cell wall biosynthesis
VVITVHDVGFLRFPEFYPRRGRLWHEKMLDRTRARADLVVVPSERVRNELVEIGFDPARVVAVGEGVDHLPPPAPEAGRRALRRHGVRGPFLLVVGTLEPRKNVQTALRAYRAACPRLPRGTMLALAGPRGWGEPPIPAPGVVFLDDLSFPELVALYGLASACIYVPRYEGFGLPPVEAMACGCPVISTPVPSVEGAPAMILEDPDDEQALAELMVRAACDEALRRDLAEKGRLFAARLRWAGPARALRAAIEDLF